MCHGNAESCKSNSPVKIWMIQKRPQKIKSFRPYWCCQSLCLSQGKKQTDTSTCSPCSSLASRRTLLRVTLFAFIYHYFFSPRFYFLTPAFIIRQYFGPSSLSMLMNCHYLTLLHEKRIAITVFIPILINFLTISSVLLGFISNINLFITYKSYCYNNSRLQSGPSKQVWVPI